MNSIINSINGRLSLREPQRQSLAILDRISEIVPPLGGISTSDALRIIQSEYPFVTSFERDFPSLCFAIATGVGKTRLMGAFITYLHLTRGIENFFVLAPSLTIYNKLISDFTPGKPKYVFKGIAEFAVNPPTILTGDNYNELAGSLFDSLSKCRINVFNISKINAEVRGGKTPKIKQLSEYIGKSYFDYLAALPDLVMLMDESHRYRASAGIRAINELKPVLGLELTATPYIETSKGAIQFQNIVYDYPLSSAMKDGFVKEPAVVTKENFSTNGMTAASIEDMKLKDGIRLHEIVKVELETYAKNTGNRLVKPFILIIARDTTHASQLLQKIQSHEISDGAYKDKVIQVDSSTKEEEVIQRLLKVEDADEPTEIVIHVNMLKEGWDVTNLYTIIPLRAASARVLIEQSIGRGLRLPYGNRTGVESVDTLNIVAHDKFQEIVDESRKSDSLFHLKTITLDEPTLNRRTKTVTSQPNIDIILNFEQEHDKKNTIEEEFSMFNTREKDIAIATYKAIQNYGMRPDLVPTRAHLENQNIKISIVKEVEEGLMPSQPVLSIDDYQNPDVGSIVEKTIQLVRSQTIDIPQIQIIPKGKIEINFRSFSLDITDFKFQPVSDKLVLQDLRTGRQHRILISELGISSEQPEDLIVGLLANYDDINYEQNSDLLYNFAGQVLKFLKTYLSEEEIFAVVKANARHIAENIYRQMQLHSTEISDKGYEVKVSRGYVPLKSSAFTTNIADAPLNYKTTPPDKNNIKQYVFTGFKKCLYPSIKFDSNTERKLSVLLEMESEKWFRPVNGQFPIYYHNGISYSVYEPDFVAETSDTIYMFETKDRTKLNDIEVQAKANAAAEWCKYATEFSMSHNGKRWKYLLIPDNEVTENRTLEGLCNEFEIRS